MQLLGNGGNLVLIVLGFSLLIAIHEMGHFLAARWAGIRVDAFAIGMGPAVVAFRRGIGWKLGSTHHEVERRLGAPPERISMERLREAGIGETEYGLRLLPLGGFVRMKGQEDLEAIESSADPDAYGSRPVWKRMVVVSAGVTANVILAVLLYVAAFMVGVRFESPTVGEARVDGPAAKATNLDGGAPGLRTGDVITRIDGTTINTFADVQIAAAMSKPGRALRIDVQRQGSEQPLRFETIPVDEPTVRLRTLGITPARDGEIVDDRMLDPVLRPALQRSGLAAAGVAAGWKLTSVNGVQSTTMERLQQVCATGDGASITTTWTSPAGATASATLQPDPQLQQLVPADDPYQWEPSLLGFVPLTRIDWVRPGSLNDGILKPGDIVLMIDAVRGPRLNEFRSLVGRLAGRQVTMQVLRDGTPTTLTARVDATGRLDVLIAAAIDQPMMARPLDRVQGGAPTAAAALELGALARIDSVGGVPVTDWASLRAALRASAPAGGASMQVKPFGVDAARTVSVVISPDDAKALQSLGWMLPLPLEAFDPLMTTLSAHGNPLRAAAMGFQETGKLVVLTWLTLDRLVRGTVPVDQLRGPVGIVHVGVRVADRGFMYLVFFLAMISVNLAVLNFLPLPIVDGGLFLYLAYEAVRGRPPSVRFQNAATMAGLLLLGSLFVVTFYNDVMRLVSGG
jgi:regulator of sigma E protease